MSADLELLLELGRRLDALVGPPGSGSVRQWLAASLLRVRDKQGRLVPLAANRAQREFERRAGRRNLVLKARQVGVTTWVAARFFLATITRPGTLTVQVAHDQQSAEEIFRIVHRFLENLPEAVRRGPHRARFLRDGVMGSGALATSRANIRQVIFPWLDSEYRVETAADPHAGRGLTIHRLHGSEVARWPGDAAETLASLRAAVPPGGEIVLESTPNGAAGCFYQEWQRAGERGYVRHFFPWWYEPAYSIPPSDLSSRGGRQSDEGSAFHSFGTSSRAAPDALVPSASGGVEGPALLSLTDEERSLAAAHNLTAGQLAYRRKLRAEFGRLAPQEFAEDPVSCFLSSGDCVFDAAAITARLSACGPAAESRDQGRLLIFFPPAHGAQYIAGVDPAGGGSDGDYACAQVIERSTGMQCAELRGHLPPAELAARVAALAREYNRALVAVERNNHGHAVLALLARLEGYDHLYQRGGQLGWLTSAVTRPPMLENFAALLGLAPHLFSSPRLLEECRTFVRHADGAAAAASGSHDDCVLAMAIAQAVRQEAIAPPRASALALESLPLR